MSLSDDDGVRDEDEGNTIEQEIMGEGNVDGTYNEDDDIELNGVEDFGKVNFQDLSAQQLMRIHFATVEVAFLFYNMYGNIKGFGARKSKTVWNINGEMIQQTFLYREGHRVERNKDEMSRRREPKPTTRC